MTQFKEVNPNDPRSKRFTASQKEWLMGAWKVDTIEELDAMLDEEPDEELHEKPDGYDEDCIREEDYL